MRAIESTLILSLDALFLADPDHTAPQVVTDLVAAAWTLTYDEVRR